MFGPFKETIGDSIFEELSSLLIDAFLNLAMSGLLALLSTIIGLSGFSEINSLIRGG
jgi:hypothetical protein